MCGKLGMRVVVILTILLSTTVQAEAQLATGPRSEQTVASHVFDQGMQRYRRPPEEWQGKPRRIRKTVESNYGNGKPLGHVSETFEFDTAGSFRKLITVDSPYQRSENEIIAVGGFTYSRKDGDPWKRSERKLTGIVEPVAPFESDGNGLAGTFKYYEPSSTFEFKITAGEHKGQIILVYIRTVVERKPRKEPGVVLETEQTNRYWMADNGRMVKFEDLKTYKKVGAWIRSTQEWELDPSIRIEAPISVGSN